jgi:hypothetical protein
MKIFLIIFLIVVLSNCTKKEDKVSYQYETNQSSASEIRESNRKMYVNSIEGLRVRNTPDINGERIALLNDLVEVLIIKEDENEITIDGVNGKWCFVNYGNIEGWVFGGFLSFSKPVRRNMNNTMENIIDYFTNNLNLDVHYYEFTNIKELLEYYNILGEYKIISKESYPRHGVIEDYYIIGSGSYNISVLGSESIPKYFLVSIDIDINRNNFSNLFPYNRINEYIADNNFGELVSYDSARITYRSKYDGQFWDRWDLLFGNGILDKVSYIPSVMD